MSETNKTMLTTPDLVVLSLLSERPMHGYQLNAVLEEREVRDWAGISRPQVYYSLKKLLASKLIKPAAQSEPSAGPERQEYATTSAGMKALADALEREEWATQRPAPPFLTWMALSTHVRPDAIKQQISRRRTFLTAEITRERETLKSIKADVRRDGSGRFTDGRTDHQTV